MVYKVYLPLPAATFPIVANDTLPTALEVSPPDSLSAARALAAAEGGYVVEFDEVSGALVNGRRV